MKRLAMILAAATLCLAGRAQAAEDKAETTTSVERNGSKTTVEKKSSRDDASGDSSRVEKRETDRHARADGTTETTKDVTTKAKPKHGKRSARHVKEKTVRDAKGDVVDHEKKVDK
jgi:hypothetical protein